MSATTFHPFPDLPMEIKLQILMTACTESTFPGHLSPDQGGLHYVNIDTIRTGGGDLLTLRVLDKQDLNDDVGISNKSEYMRNGGLWGACKLSRAIITVKTIFMRHKLIDAHQHDVGSLAILPSRNSDEAHGYIHGDWKSLPESFEQCNTGLPSFDPLSSAIIPTPTLAVEFDSSWIVDLPKTLDELKAENSARGLVATWMEGVASGWVQTPQLYLIDKGTLFVSQTPGYSPVYHDCDGKYIRMYEEWCGDAISAFILALDELLSLDKYGDLYKENSPDSWDEDAEEWLEFDIFSNIKVLARFEYADHKEVSWTAVCNDLYNDDVRGSEHAVTSYGRVYDLTYDDDVGYCVGEFGNPRVLSSSDDDDESGSDDDLGRVEYVKLF
ncbi:uncharacterized protein FFB20_10660 [Fusarium fujikuroi]|uniref:Uncharacterized protein n=1 Tax=Fusarium fujikuroi TaxID=5127 RepID=A0A5Q3F9J9_FUSFU|nr:hypothetical protein CEK27_003047 [Fusarium fujikuroi]QGI88064.1 hypothetical protein CEK25_003020 [Fusarium fujikuroi]QGJ01609.1 hypothetical protein CEK26_003053 [Fusarium fujikuroi]SCN98389.1 uncharacterized protein FFB20_10660 [Fusarium fujikuroi]SCO21032.1 uncharacterized protein FFE2_14819 [Fusarium fujikuroi]